MRNCSDGSVEAQFEGDADAVEQMLDVMREGPPGARVDHIAVETADSEGHAGFEVRH